MVGNSPGTNLTSFKELPNSSKPREKAKRYGIDSLSNEELLAILLGTGSKDISVLELAHTLLKENQGLFNLFSKPYQALIDTKGIGEGKALILSACFELCNRYKKCVNEEAIIQNSQDLYNRYSLLPYKEDREMFLLVIINLNKAIIHEEILYKGCEYSVECEPMQIMRKVIIHNGKGFYIIHNHPSGDCRPSKDDVMTTAQIVNASERVGIPLIDHIVISRKGYYSFKNDDRILRKRPNC